MKKIFGLVDCNNFYVSCERIFNPGLEGKPVIVLSNNDGCAIARSSEVKALGIPMGIPVFKIKDLIKEHNIKLYSPNFTLYGNISSRVMHTLENMVPDIEVYSIDEAFLDLTNISDVDNFAKNIRSTIKQNIGMPVSIGIGPTKTLAKIANKIAKSNKNSEGVFNFLENDIDRTLENVGVDDVWGIGRKFALKLKSHNIYTAKQFKDLDRAWVKQEMHVFGERMQLELGGISCLPFEDLPQARKGIMVTRTFGSTVVTKDELHKLLVGFVSKAAEKLRQQKSVAGHLHIFVKTDIHKKTKQQYFNSIGIKLPNPTSYTPTLIEYVGKGLDRIFKSGYEYRRGGVNLSEISSANISQSLLFEQNDKKNERLMSVMDSINKHAGRSLLRFASSGSMPPARIENSHKSLKYTTNWNELLGVT